MWRHLYSGWCEAHKYCFVCSISLFNPNNFLNNRITCYTRYNIFVIFSFYYRYIREGHQCPGSFQETGSSFEKNEYAKRFFLVSAYTKKMQKLRLNLYQGAYCSQKFKSTSWKLKSTSWNLKVEVKIHKLRVRIHELRVRMNELRVRIHDLWVRIYGSLSQ